VCLSLGALTACGGGSGSAAGPADSPTAKTPAVSPVQAVQAAYTKTADEHSMQFALDGKIAAAGMNMTIGGSGVEDVTTKAADITMTMPLVGTMEMRLVDGVVYAKIGGENASGSINTGGKWMKLDDTTAETLGTDSSFDADEMLALLKATSSSGVTERGTATVRGVQTTHYAAQLDIAKLAAIGGDSVDDSDVQSMLKETGLSSIPLDLYLDAQGRLRRLGMSMTMKGTSSPSSSSEDESNFPMSGTVSMTMDFFNFGVPVHVTAPPASEITDGSDLLSGLDDLSATDD
jgi:hypothetical protein